MKKILAIFFAAILTACGGGGGDSDSSASQNSSMHVSYNGGSITASGPAGLPLPLAFSFAVNGIPDKAVWVVVEDPQELITPGSLNVVITSSTQVDSSWTIKSILPAARYTGTFTAHACTDSSCTTEYAGSPAKIPYDILLTAPATTSASVFHATPGVAAAPQTVSVTPATGDQAYDYEFSDPYRAFTISRQGDLLAITPRIFADAGVYPARLRIISRPSGTVTDTPIALKVDDGTSTTDTVLPMLVTRPSFGDAAFAIAALPSSAITGTYTVLTSNGNGSMIEPNLYWVSINASNSDTDEVFLQPSFNFAPAYIYNYQRITGHQLAVLNDQRVHSGALTNTEITIPVGMADGSNVSWTATLDGAVPGLSLINASGQTGDAIKLRVTNPALIPSGNQVQTVVTVQTTDGLITTLTLSFLRDQ